MSNANSDTTPVMPVNPGEIQFLDNFVPTLDPGQYTVTVAQALALDPTASGTPPADFPPPGYSSSLTMTVGGAGLALQPSDIYSIYPPDKSEADYTQVLPHIVLRTRTVPWEVQLDTTSATVPWMALMIFADGDIITTQTLPLAQAQQTPSGTLAPQVPAGEAANTTAPVTVIDISGATFSSLAPRLSEVPFLAHCRQVNVVNKEDGLSTGWFAAIIANRFPVVPQGAAKARLTAHLVSIYGLDPYLTSPTPQLPSTVTNVRLLSLANWSFTCDQANGLDFRALMTNLAVPPAGTAAGDSSYLLLKLPTNAAASGSGTVNFNDAIHQAVGSTLANGYVPVPYRTRQGDAVTAWYRGPLCPTPTPRLKLDPITIGGEAMTYDQASGMFDQSYAVAWETGRLLALSDRAFATNLLEWRGKGQHLLNQLYFNIQQNPALAGTMDQPSNNANVQQLRSLLEPNVLATTTFLPYVSTAFAKTVGITVPTLPTVPLPAEAGPPSTPVTPAVSAGLSAVMSQPWVATALQSLQQAQLDVIAEWLGRMCLLNGVPFNNLVPDARMLPAESIRFFYIDQTYLDAMVDGAISVGVHSSRDTQYNQIMYRILRDAVNTVVMTLRAELLGIPPSPAGVSGSMGGFLLRSAAVSGWPGLEVKAYQASTTAGGATTVMPALRIDRLAPDVLFALFPAVAGRIELSEPQEGLRFGVVDGATAATKAIELRNVSATGTPGAELGFTATPAYRGTPGVFDVTSTLAAIGQKAASLASIGPAGFAVQMVKSPEQMVFYGAGA